MQTSNKINWSKSHLYPKECIIRYTANYTCEIETVNVNQKLLNVKIVLMITTTVQI